MKLKQVGNKSKVNSMTCDFCSSEVSEDESITITEGGLLFISCVECELLNEECDDRSGQMSATDAFNHFYIQPSVTVTGGEEDN
ncbi:MAG: hypothetical protein ACON5J_19065 [Rubripirellula sp.]